MTYRTCLGLLIDTEDRAEAEEITRQFVADLLRAKESLPEAFERITPLVGPVLGYTTSTGPITEAEYAEAAAAHEARRRR